jgi:hypothetical protein
MCDNLPKMLGVPVGDDGAEQVQPYHAIMLASSAPITDYALATDMQGILAGVVGLTSALPTGSAAA